MQAAFEAGLDISRPPQRSGNADQAVSQQQHDGQKPCSHQLLRIFCCIHSSDLRWQAAAMRMGPPYVLDRSIARGSRSLMLALPQNSSSSTPADTAADVDDCSPFACRTLVRLESMRQDKERLQEQTAHSEQGQAACRGYEELTYDTKEANDHDVDQMTLDAGFEPAEHVL